MRADVREDDTLSVETRRSSAFRGGQVRVAATVKSSKNQTVDHKARDTRIVPTAV